MVISQPKKSKISLPIVDHFDREKTVFKFELLRSCYGELD